MDKPKVEDYLMQGIYGKKEINPQEKKKYLGTFRERVVIALTQSQVREKEIFKEVEEAMKKNEDGKLLLNGHMEYGAISKYIDLCNKLNVKYTIVTNKEYNSEYGLILAKDYAVNNENIFVETKKISYKEVKKPKKGVLSFFSKVFRK